MIITAVSKSGKGYYVCPMRRLHRCKSPSIKRELVDVNMIEEILFNFDKLQIESNQVSLQETLEKNSIDLQFQINSLVQALTIAPEVNVLAGKVRELDRKLKKIETTIKVLKNKAKKDKSRGSKELNLSLKEDREICRRLAFKSFREVYIDTETKQCDIYFTNGLVFKNFPLSKRCRADSIISTLKYMDENTVYF